MNPRESDIQRVAKDYIPGHCRSEKITGNLVEKIALHREAQISQRKVLTVNTTAPRVISDCSDVIVMCPIVSRKKSEAEFVSSKVTLQWRWGWGEDFL
jgi:hypothetical protein